LIRVGGGVGIVMVTTLTTVNVWGGSCHASKAAFTWFIGDESEMVPNRTWADSRMNNGGIFFPGITGLCSAQTKESSRRAQC
jgi:hypothetical protein